MPTFHVLYSILVLSSGCVVMVCVYNLCAILGGPLMIGSSSKSVFIRFRETQAPTSC